MLTEGEDAPPFQLPGNQEGNVDTYSLQEAAADDQAVLLLFYPFDFSPVCTTELCAIRDAEWFQFTSGLEVWAISGDSTYAHAAFIEEHNLNFPLLSDYHASVAAAYDVRYEEFEHHEAVPKRAVYVVDSTQTIQYAWATDNAYEKPDFVPVEAAVNELATTEADLAPDDLGLDITYDEPSSST